MHETSPQRVGSTQVLIDVIIHWWTAGAESADHLCLPLRNHVSALPLCGVPHRSRILASPRQAGLVNRLAEVENRRSWKTPRRDPWGARDGAD